MYTKYITKNGKKVGPYYYDSIRLPGGKVRTVYLGRTPTAAKKKRALLRKHQTTPVPQRSSATVKHALVRRRHHFSRTVTRNDRIIMTLFFFFVFISIFSATYDSFPNSRNLVTGNVILQEEEEVVVIHEHPLQTIITKSTEYYLEVSGITSLESLSISGRVASQQGGNVKLFLTDDASKDTFLLFDSDALDVDISTFFKAVSGLAVGEIVNITDEETIIEEEIEYYSTLLSQGLLKGRRIVDILGRSHLFKVFEYNETTDIHFNQSFIETIHVPTTDKRWIVYQEYSSAGLIEPDNVSFTNVFGFDISAYNSTNTSLTFTAPTQSDYLYRCTFWDIEVGICLGQWAYTAALNGTVNYTQNITSSVMAFAEGIFDPEEPLEEIIEVIKEEAVVEDVPYDPLIDFMTTQNITNMSIASFTSLCGDACNLRDTLGTDFTLKVYVKDAILSLEQVTVETTSHPELNYGLSLIDLHDQSLLLTVDDTFIEGVVERNITKGTANSSVTYDIVETNKPVRWTNHVTFDIPTTDAVVILPPEATNINVTSILYEEKQSTQAKQLLADNRYRRLDTLVVEEQSFIEQAVAALTDSSITGLAVDTLTGEPLGVDLLNETNTTLNGTEEPVEDIPLPEGTEQTIIIENEVTEAFVSYDLPGPTTQEIPDSYGKEIMVTTPESFDAVLVSTGVPELLPEDISLTYGVDENGTAQSYPYTPLDTNGNGRIDTITWTTSLSPEVNKTFHVGLTIITVQSYPKVSGNWVVKFQTTGQADLHITAVDGTTWLPYGTTEQLKFLQIICGDNVKEYEWIDGSVVIENYQCGAESQEVSQVLQPGKHTLKFDFGSNTAYAYNSATDFKIQRGDFSITGVTNHTLHAGTDYDAPANNSYAFIRITNTNHVSSGDNITGGLANADDVAVYIFHDGANNLTENVTFSRFGAATSAYVNWEIIEYIGPIGGDNEIIVRARNTLDFGSTTMFVDTADISNYVNHSQIVPFITGQGNRDTGRTDYNTHAFITNEFTSQLNVTRFTRGEHGSDANRLSFAVVEFTGDNWDVERVQHGYTTAGVHENETTGLGNDLAKTFIHVQKSMGNIQDNINQQGHVVYFSADNTLTFLVDGGSAIAATTTAVAYIIENTQTDGTPAIVTRSSGTQSGGTEPIYLNASIGKTLDDLTVSSIFGSSYSTGTGNSFLRYTIGLMLVTTSEYQIMVSDTGQTRTYRVEVVEWPTSAATLNSVPNIDLQTPVNLTVFAVGTTNVTLEVNVTDDTNPRDNVTVTIFGNRTGVPGEDDLLYKGNVTNGSTIYYNWTYYPFDVDSDMIFGYHFDMREDHGENLSRIKDWAENYNGTINESLVTINFSNAILGGNVELNGNNEFILVDDCDFECYKTRNATYMAWVRTNSVAAGQGVVMGGWSNSFTVGLVIYRNAAALAVGTDGNVATLNTADFFTVGEWVHLALVQYDNKTLRLYRNGVFQEVNTYSDITDASSQEDFVIGKLEREGGNWWGGGMDEVYVINRSLTEAEIVNYLDLDNGQHYWFAEANDSAAAGSDNFNNTPTWEFLIGGNGPQVTELIEPVNNSNFTEVGPILLNASVVDPEGDGLEVRIYATNGTVSTAIATDDLVFYNTSVPNNSQSAYNITAPLLDLEDDVTRLLAHFDENSDFSNATNAYNFANGSKNGTVLGSAKVVKNEGKLAGAYKGEGTDDEYVDFGTGNAALIGKDNFTYLMWVNPDDTSGSEGLLATHNGATNVGFALKKNSAALEIYGNAEIITVSSFFTAGEWVHIGVVVNTTGGVAIYKNGNLEQEGTLSTIGTGNALIVGNSRDPTNNFVQGWQGYIDEVAIYNRSFTADDINDSYRLRSGTYYWNVNVTDSANNSDVNGTFLFRVDRQPVVTNITISPTAANLTNTTADLNCSFVVIDDLDAEVTAHVTFRKEDEVQTTTTVTAATGASLVGSDILPSFNTAHFDNWSCNVTVLDNASTASLANESVNTTIENYIPHYPTLTYPINDTDTVNFTFIWKPDNTYGQLPPEDAGCGVFFCDGNHSDVDGDNVTYYLNMTCVNDSGGSCDKHFAFQVRENITNCDTNSNGIFDLEDNCTYTFENESVYFSDDNYHYEWFVQAGDPYENASVHYGQSTVNRTIVNFLVEAGITLLNNTVAFGRVLESQFNTTEACTIGGSGPGACPLYLENTGNARVTLNFTGGATGLWDSVSATDLAYFSFKVANGTESNDAYDEDNSLLVYTALPAEDAQLIVIERFEYMEGNDEATIHVNVTVPTGEPEGDKNITLNITIWYPGVT